MNPQMYLELASNIDVARCEEWIGREYARDYPSTAYPIPPDQWIGPPTEPPPEMYTYFWTRALPMAAIGGVIVLDDEIVRFATQPQTLSDGSLYSLDIAAQAKTAEQLSAAAQAAIVPGTPP